jgi:hypothetical protein
MAISVNKVYRTVLSIINKEGRGFLTPDQFNRIGREVQLDLLERAFFDYNKAVNKEKANITNNGYANIPKIIKEKIDIFSKESEITITGIGAIKSGVNVRQRTTIVGVSIPTQITAGTYSNLATTTNGSGTGLTVTVVAATNSFTTITTVVNGSGYVAGDIVTIPQSSMTGANNPYTFPIEITDIISGNVSLPSDLYRVINISRSNRSVNFDELGKSEYTYVNSSKLTTPSKTYPVYYRGYNGVHISPISLIGENLTLDYIKIPSDPYWGFTKNSSNGSYEYTSGTSTDFELHESDEVDLIIKILGYAGVVIKDPTIIQVAGGEENKVIQLEN